ncbi:MAG: zinc-binding metallopeptidase family protein [Opitutaceae bacterium]
MRIFQCANCNHPVFFDNVLCHKCGSALGFSLENYTLVTLARNNGKLVDLFNANVRYTYCANEQHGACNWLVPESSHSSYCAACNLNSVIPDIHDESKMVLWRELEKTKRRLIYSLYRFSLPIQSKVDDPQNGLSFEFLSDDPSKGNKGRILTGHSNGVITINIAEADSAYREKARSQMGESYRSLIGHFRHEVGHYYWDRLIYNDESLLTQFRALFGDERADYGEALKKHYEDGPVQGWESIYVSSYAAAHPWEDWAETWAHYHHFMATLESAYSFGLSTEPLVRNDNSLKITANFDPYIELDFERIAATYIPLTLAINSLNRSMGQPDLYPFVVPAPAMQKLAFIHSTLHR